MASQHHIDVLHMDIWQQGEHSNSKNACHIWTIEPQAHRKHLNTSAAVRKDSMKTQPTWDMGSIQPWDRCTTMNCRQTGNSWHNQHQAVMTHRKDTWTQGRHETHETQINSRQTWEIWTHSGRQTWGIWKKQWQAAMRQMKHKELAGRSRTYKDETQHSRKAGDRWKTGTQI